ncbi:MAG: 30S ribosomal protein S17 [Candidatus Caldatribacterium sp.]|uniref:30S ribosomal protein S17 n=1 Tax=Candidatus Caldatribacterium sp. TaxID=2282143 RepID=UPI002997BC76|nr:30S ribosomal protein S17 [Candidatus Caldatribacterium sp.]MCX7731204.1 30S ribosomal protein S17 [Candidatus Caldatribacterium sp.]MDW8082085.1 30S ribosomal protein S17 [Candidatus Calescibacterium sp.]
MGMRKRFVGEVVSDAMDKTVVVRVERITEHPLYKKKIRRSVKFKAHDENNMCSVGDKVLIEETRPLSRTKRWRVVALLERAKVKGGEEVDSAENYA